MKDLRADLLSDRQHKSREGERVLTPKDWEDTNVARHKHVLQNPSLVYVVEVGGKLTEIVVAIDFDKPEPGSIKSLRAYAEKEDAKFDLIKRQRPKRRLSDLIPWDKFFNSAVLAALITGGIAVYVASGSQKPPLSPSPTPPVATTAPPASVKPAEPESPTPSLAPDVRKTESSAAAPAPVKQQTVLLDPAPPNQNVQPNISAIPQGRELTNAENLLGQLGDTHALVRADRLSHLLNSEKLASLVSVDAVIALLGDIPAPAFRRHSLNELLANISRPLTEQDLLKLLDGFNGANRGLTLEGLVACARLPFDEAQTERILADVPPPSRQLLAQALRSPNDTRQCPSAQR